MGTIQVVLGSTLVQAADRAALRTGQNRSGLIRDALREHLRRMEIRELEARDRRGYETESAPQGDASVWEAEAVWPAE
jgi:metal-responsive CopG/Arc/MetJ family transcriptional regulator